MLADEKEINAADSSADPSVDQPAFVHVSLEDTPQSGLPIFLFSVFFIINQGYIFWPARKMPPPL